jgi:MFS family permease
MLMQAAGFGWIALIARADLAYPQLIAPMILAGCGVSLAMPATQNAVIGAVPPQAIGKASGTFNTLRQLGGAFGVAVTAAVFGAAGSYASPSAFSRGFAAAIGIGAGLSVAAALAGLRTPVRHRAEADQGQSSDQPALVGK